MLGGALRAHLWAEAPTARARRRLSRDPRASDPAQLARQPANRGLKLGHNRGRELVHPTGEINPPGIAGPATYLLIESRVIQ